MPRQRISIEEMARRLGDTSHERYPNVIWQSGNTTWPGTVDVEPMAPNATHVTGIVSPAKTRYRFNGADGGPSIEAIVEVRKGYPELTSITVSNLGTGGVITDDLRNVSIPQLIENVVMLTAAERSTKIGEGVWRSDTFTDDDASAMRNASRRSRRSATALQAEIARAAHIYRETIGAGQPQKAVRDKLGLSERTAARRIQQARAAGLLPKTKKGQARA